MSGTRGRTANAEGQDLVFCHECENEWYKTGENGLTCPACQSSFTEIIEPDYDPRAPEETPQLQLPLHDHNPWADDPDEDDIEHLHTHQFGVPSPYAAGGAQHIGGNRDPRQPYNQPGNYDQNPFSHPLFGNFASMLQDMQGRQGQTGMLGMPAGLRPYQAYQPPANGGAFRSQSAPDARPSSGVAPGVHRQVFDGSNMHMEFTVGTIPAYGQRGPNGMEVDVNEVIHGLFSTIGGRPSGNGGAAGLVALFNGMFDPANAAHGDAVYSQEAFDRVVSQLMDQHPTGNAPPRATAAAIADLPKKRLSKDMLDENTGKAECSICIDEVPLGEEIVSLPCKHWFHKECVEAWLKERDSCPICRQGIMPKDGPQDSARHPTQAPMHDEDPVNVARRQSGTRDHPFVVDESPTRARRRPSHRRHSSSRMSESGGASQPASGGGTITDRVRSFFGGGGNND